MPRRAWLTDARLEALHHHPEGYLEAFANLYSEIAEAILDKEAGRDGTYLFPTVEAGLRGVAMLFAALDSSRCGARFARLETAEDAGARRSELA